MADEKFPSLRDKATWLGRDIVDQGHSQDLERMAAINEFEHGMPREMAEAKAYQEYRVDQHAQAAAHHLVGMKHARAGGAHEESDRHALMYEQHVKAMGESPHGAVPAAVQAHEQKAQEKETRLFKPHKWDNALSGVSK